MQLKLANLSIIAKEAKLGPVTITLPIVTIPPFSAASTSPINEVENFAEPHTSMAYKTVPPNPPSLHKEQHCEAHNLAHATPRPTIWPNGTNHSLVLVTR